MSSLKGKANAYTPASRTPTRSRPEYFQKVLEIIDFLVIAIGLIVNIVLLQSEGSHTSAQAGKYVIMPTCTAPIPLVLSRVIILPRLFRVFNLVRTIRILHHRKHLKIGSRHLVGQNKKRTIGNGFDLDLCCITGKQAFLLPTRVSPSRSLLTNNFALRYFR